MRLTGVVDVRDVVAVVGEAAEARPIEVDGQRVVRGDQDVNPHVELFVADEERVMNVTLYDVGFWLVGGVCPVGDVVEGPKEEDAFALAPADLDSVGGTGFMIQMVFCSLLRLNYSRKMGY